MCVCVHMLKISRFVRCLHAILLIFSLYRSCQTCHIQTPILISPRIVPDSHSSANTSLTPTLLLRSYMEDLQRTPKASLASSRAFLPRTLLRASATISLPDHSTGLAEQLLEHRNGGSAMWLLCAKYLLCNLCCRTTVQP